MPLSAQQIVLKGRSEYAHEQEALEFIRSALPDTHPFLVWELVQLVDPSTGRLHEIDAIILGYRALYLVEIKSGPGVYTGDTVDWYRQPPGESPRLMTPPYPLTNHKAKVLKGLISRRMNHREIPWIQPLVFLSNEDVTLKLQNYGDQCVVTRKNFTQAIRFHQFPGSEQQRGGSEITRPQLQSIVRAMGALGIRASEGALRVGTWKLGEVLESGPGYEDRLASHVDQKTFKRRARTYLVPEQTSTERRQQLRRAAMREAQLLEDVKGHPNILRINDYISDAPLGPTVLFDPFEGVPLPAFLRQEKTLSFSDRIELIAQIGRALEHCHKKEVYHGGLCPSAVLVRRTEQGAIDSRVYNFQLGSSADASHTMHWSALAEEDWGAYQAPELRENPSAPRGPADMFSLGALAFYVLTGRAPAANAADADRKLKEQHLFDPLSVDDSLSEGIADLVGEATHWNSFSRWDQPGPWVELLIAAATNPGVAPPEEDPLEAKKGDVLAGTYTVEQVLGQGASSRVLKVSKSDGRSYALKVALNDVEDERLTEEAAVLGGLRHSRIVQLYEAPTIGKRKCLVLALAGEKTLQRRLKEEGLISLDYAARFGEDLLSALESLEDENILHRDIKPANIGVGQVSKKAHHLTLFDFSLGIQLRGEAGVRHGLSQITIGTAAYRDPYLVDRGAWDFAADRYSAAITLHEMLTGTRPSWTPEGASARDPEARLVLASERFDAAVRDRLTAFFEQALAADVTARHVSAESMRLAWNECFAAQTALPPKAPVRSITPQPMPAVVGPSEEPEEASDVDLVDSFDFGQVAPNAPLAALPLSGRALNALDRAGVTRVSELASLPDNRLSAVRGVGKQVVREVITVTKRWLAARPDASATVTPFFPGYSGADLLVSQSTLVETLSRALQDAGLATLRALAEAPAHQVEHLAKRAHADVAALTRVLAAAQQEQEQRTKPTSVDGFLRALLPSQKRRAENVKIIFGLAGPKAGQTDILVAHAARALNVTAPALYIQLGHCKDDWGRHPAFEELAEAAHDVVDKAGGALPIERAAAALLERYPATPQLAELCENVKPERQPIVAACALLRIVGIVEKEKEEGLRWERLDREPWLLAKAELIKPVLALGEAADELAKRESVASSGETVRALRAVAEGTAFSALSDERLTELAAAASENAARSSRLELYPRGLSAKRAIELSNATLVGDLKPEDVQRRVQARYPEAQPLPLRPELDALLKPLGLVWNDTKQMFARPSQTSASVHTRVMSSLATLPTNQRALDPEHIEASDFEERVRIALERGRFRVLAVRMDVAATAALSLSKAFGLDLVDLNQELTQGLAQLMQDEGIDEDVVHQIDREHTEDWRALTEMMSDVSTRLLERLAQEPQARLLVNPGLLARYGLDGFLRKLVHKCREPGSKSTFLLVPGPDTPGVPRINGSLVIPEVGTPDALTVSTNWLRKKAS